MAKDAYHELFVHLVWHTKDSAGIIPPEAEDWIHEIIRQRLLEPGGIFVHQIGGTRNHVHAVARINPTVAVARWVGQVKGGSSHDINAANRLGVHFEWQSGYGVVSFGAKDLEWAVRYVANQKEHHLKGSLLERLERFSEDD
jgi:putative transposase